MAAMFLSLKKALYPTASASLFFLKHLNPIAPSAHHRWFRGLSSPEFRSLSSHDDISDSEIATCHKSECLYAYENPSVQCGSQKLFELDMYPHEARVRVDLPGVDRSGVKVLFVDEDYLVVRGIEMPSTRDSRAYTYTIMLRQTELLKKEETRAEIQNGVLRVIIPKDVPQEEEENNEEDGIKVTVTGSITSPADVPVVSF